MGRGSCVVVLAAGLAAAGSVAADDWPHWRGPTRDGHTTEASGWTGGDWLAVEPAWTKNVGAGCSSPLIFRGKVYVHGYEPKEDVVRCLSLADGREEWARRSPAPRHGRFHKGEEALYGGPSATPEIDTATGLLYTLGIDGDLRCWDPADRGRPVWAVTLTDAYDVKQRPMLTKVYHRDYGYTAAPLVYGDWVIAEVGSAAKGTFVAFDKRSGKEAWRSELKDEGGHTGGLAPITVEGVPCLVGLTQRNVAIVRLDPGRAGQTVATSPWVTEGDCNIASPLVVGSSVLVTSGYNQNAVARFDVTLAGMTEAWRTKFSSKVCSPVYHDGAVYYSWMKVTCLDWQTGKKKWDGGSFADAGSCVVTADGRLVVYGYNGKLGLVEGAGRSPAEYRELAVRDKLFRATAWPHVAVGGGRVVCRDKDGNLACFAVTGAGK